MCRLAAYLGPRIFLQRFLNDPPHNLIHQSWAPQEMDEAVLNADGFGFGWYPQPEKPVTYLSTQPAWSDPNLESLSQSLSSHLWMGYVRSATPGQMTGLANTQPFKTGHLLFIHNGLIKNFNQDQKIRFHEYLTPEIQTGINGNTDSEYLFAVLRQQMAEKPDTDIPTLLIDSLKQIKSIIKNGTTLLNIIVSDGNRLYATRHAVNGSCPSLYFTYEDALFPDAIVIASERMTTGANWHTVPEHSMVITTGNSTPEVVSL